MRSPEVKGGIILNRRGAVEPPATFEVAVDTNNMDGTTMLGFLDEAISPTVNTDVHRHMLAHFVIRKDNWYINGEPNKPLVIRGKYLPNVHVFRITLGPEWLTFYVDGAEVARVRNTVPPRRTFFISADPYTTHYTGRVDILAISVNAESSERDHE